MFFSPTPLPGNGIGDLVKWTIFNFFLFRYRNNFYFVCTLRCIPRFLIRERLDFFFSFPTSRNDNYIFLIWVGTSADREGQPGYWWLPIYNIMIMINLGQYYRKRSLRVLNECFILLLFFSPCFSFSRIYFTLKCTLFI